MKYNQLGALVLLPFLCSCGLWDSYERPQTELPKAWVASVADAKEGWPDSDWWKTFESQTLTTQIETAKTTNLDLKAAFARVKQADAQLREAGAPLFPFITANGSVDRSKNSSITIGAPTHIRNTVRGTLDASYEIDFWGKNWAARDAAQALDKASIYDRQTVELTILASVATAYFDVLATQERLQIAKDDVADAEKLLDAIQRRFAQGLSSGLDVAQQENLVATQRATIPALATKLQQSRSALAILLGKLPEDLESYDEKLDAITVPPVIAGLPSSLLERRPDVQNAEQQLISANANIAVARAQFFPSIDLTASGGYGSTALSNLFKSGNLAWSLAGSATQPIFEGGRLLGQFQYAKAVHEELLANYQKVILAAFQDAEDSLTAAVQNAEQEKFLAEALAAATRANDMSRKRFDSGVIDITTVLNTQHSLFTARDAYLQIRQARLASIVSLYKALGGGWKNPDAPAEPKPDEKKDENPSTNPDEKITPPATGQAS